ncbi:MAG: hypothetical protein AAB967_00920 [Patescibacteria group bacterium]
MEEDIKKELEEIKALLAKTYASAEKTRRYFLWTLIVAIVVTVLPLVGLVFAIPAFLSGISGITDLGL